MSSVRLFRAPPSRRDDEGYRAAERAVWTLRGLEPQERWVEVPELGIRVRAMVHGQGRPVVFVHGNPTAGGVFVPLVAALDGVQAIVVDRPGCGLSDPLDYSQMSARELRDAIEAYLVAVIDQLAGGRADLVGNSAGGMAILAFAARRPERVRSVVIEGVPSVEGMRLSWPMRAVTLPPVTAAVQRHRVTERDLRASFRTMGHGGIIDTPRLPKIDLEWRVAVARLTDTFPNDLALLQRAATVGGPRRHWAAELLELAAVKAPALWLVGDQDPFLPRAGVEPWVARMRDATLHMLIGCGHQPWLDDPDWHAEAIGAWWRSVGS